MILATYYWNMFTVLLIKAFHRKKIFSFPLRKLDLEINLESEHCKALHLKVLNGWQIRKEAIRTYLLCTYYKVLIKHFTWIEYCSSVIRPWKSKVNSFPGTNPFATNFPSMFAEKSEGSVGPIFTISPSYKVNNAHLLLKFRTFWKTVVSTRAWKVGGWYFFSIKLYGSKLRVRGVNRRACTTYAWV